MDALAPLPVAPHNIEAEQALLGAILINNDAYYRVSDFLAEEDFYEPLHREIFGVITKLMRVGKSATLITIKSFLPVELAGLDVTPAQYLARLSANAATIVNAYDYGHAIHDAAVRRGLLELAQDLTSAVLTPDALTTAAAQIEEAERVLYELSDHGGKGSAKGLQTFARVTADAVSSIAAAFQRDGRLSGIASGFTDLDRMMGGLQKSDLIIIAARPSMGKTALATNIALHAASKFKAEGVGAAAKGVDGARVGFFSLEMSSEQLAMRIIADRCNISALDLRQGNIRDSQFSDLVDATNLMSSYPLTIDDTGALSISQLAAKARRMSRQKGLDLIVVDYLQLMTAPGRRGDGRVAEITEITTGLKAVAKELNVPVIALSQLSRQVESREDKRPQLHDLRESGSIEQDADVVMFLYREEYYLERSEPPESETAAHEQWLIKFEAAKGKADLIIGKQRHGPTGNIPLSFNGRLTRFTNLANPSFLPEKHDDL